MWQLLLSAYLELVVTGTTIGTIIVRQLVIRSREKVRPDLVKRGVIGRCLTIVASCTSILLLPTIHCGVVTPNKFKLVQRR